MFGRELILDFTVSDLDKLCDERYIIKWVRALVQDIDMTIHRDMIIFDTWAPKGKPEAFGTSLCTLLTTSNLSLHTAQDRENKEKGIIFLNVFSCNEFKLSDVLDNIESFWKDVEYKHTRIINR